jgi:hypothetical protein
VERGQHRTGAAASTAFPFRHGENPAAKSAAPQVLGQKKPLNRQEAEIGAAQQAAGDLLCFRIADEDREGTCIRAPACA